MSPEFTRRARPALGTLVEVGLPARLHDAGMVQVAFGCIAQLEAELSRFMAHSDITRFNALHAGECVALRASTRAVLTAAQDLFERSEGLFDISTGTAPQGWRLDDEGAWKLDAQAQLDLGGIAKGYIVDQAVRCLQNHGVAAGWVNAGGDLRAFGEIEVPILLRDEHRGAAQPFARLADGAFATSHYAPETRAQLAGPSTAAHVSLAAPLCLWADALTKLVACSGDPQHPLLARYGAQAWCH